MELLQVENVGPVATDIWRGSGYLATGPNAVVFLVDGPLADDTETMRVQVAVNPLNIGEWSVVEDVTTIPADYSSFSGHAGFQSAPVPLVDNTWQAYVRIKHDSPTDKTFVVKVIAL